MKQREIRFGSFWNVKTTEGLEIVPGYLATADTIGLFLDGDVKRKPRMIQGWYVKRDNTTGYDDCTAWDGPFRSESEARAFRGE